MKDERIHIIIEGEELFIASGDRLSPIPNHTEFVRSDPGRLLFHLLQIKIVLTASGQIMLTSERLPGFDEAGKTAPALPIDVLAATMVRRVIAAPDVDDIAALDLCIERLETARTSAEQTREHLHGN